MTIRFSGQYKPEKSVKKGLWLGTLMIIILGTAEAIGSISQGRSITFQFVLYGVLVGLVRAGQNMLKYCKKSLS